MALPNPEIKLPKLQLPRLPRRGPAAARRSAGPAVTGLHLEPGEAVAAEARADNGALRVTRAASVALPEGAFRDGEVADAQLLGAELKRLFGRKGLPKRVRVGVANPRTVLRTIDLPPLESAGDVAAAVRLHAPEHIAMPLDQALVDHQVLGLVETPEGPRTRVVVAATERASVERLLEALRRAGVRAEGIDLTAFALIRGLHGVSAATADEPVLYASIGGTTTLAIAQGDVCRFTRVAPVGLDLLAERLVEAGGESGPAGLARLVATGLEGPTEDPTARLVLDGGVAQLADEVRTAVEFFASQWDAAVQEIVVTGPALAVPGLPETLGLQLGLPVRAGFTPASSEVATTGIDPWRLSVAAGLAVAEVPA